MEAFVLIDPLLPTGAFAHSLGLEPARIARAVGTLLASQLGAPPYDERGGS
jgi:urease accessory protein UreF